MANSDIIKIGFDYRSSLAQFEKDTNGVFDGISDKAGKQKITIQLDAKDDKVIDKIKELQKLKLDKFTFEFGDSGLKEQLQTFDKLENKINEIISLSKRIDLSFNTKNKTEAYNQLKKYADAFKNYYGNEEAMATNAGTKAGYAYYKAYEEALRKGVAQSKLEKVTIDFDVNSPFRTKENVVERRIEEFKKFQKYGDTDESTLIGEITTLENRLLKFNSAYSQVKANLGDAPITPEITKNIEEYVSWLEIAENRAKDAELFGGYSSEDFNSDKDFANMYLDFAKENATTENKKYIESLKQEETQAVATAEAEQKLAEAQKNLSSIGSDDNSEKNILNVQKQLAEIVNKTTISFEDFKVVLNNLPDNKIVQLNKTLDRTSDLTSDVGTSLSVMTSELGKFFTIEGVRSSTSFFLNNNGEFTRKPDKRKTSFSNDALYTSGMSYDYSEVAKIAYNKLKDLSLPNVSQDVNKINELTQSYNKLNNEIEKWIDNNVNKQMSPATYNFDDHENAIKLMQNYIGELNQLKSNDGYTYMSQSIKDNVEQSINYLSKLISVSEKAIETQNRFKSQDKLDNEIRKMTGTTAGDEYNKYFSMLSQGTEIEDILEQVRKDFDLTYNEATQKWEKISSVISSSPQESNISSENIIGSQAKENTQALNDEINSVNSLISAFRKLYETNKKSYKGGESLLVGNFDGSTLSHMGADFSSIETDVIDGTIKAFKDTTNQVVSFLAHTHPSDVAAFSAGDIYNAFFDYINNQIKNYFIIAKKEISWFDTSSLDGIDHEEFLEKFKDNKERIVQDIQEETQVWGNFSKYLTNIFDGDLYGGLTKLVKDSIDNSIANLGEHKIPEDVLNSLYIGLEEKVRKYIDSINDNDFVSASTVINTLRRNIGSGLEEYSMSKPAFANGGASRLDSTMWKNLYDELKSVFDTANQQNENIQNGIKQALIETLSSYGINADDVYKSMSFDDFSKAIVDGNLSATQSAREAIEVFKQEAQTVENISSETPIKDVFQSETEKSGMDAIASATEEAVQAKKDFATANEGVQSSIDGSKSPLQLEAELMDQIAKSAREAANAKKEFVEANKQVKDSADGSNDDLTDGHSENAEPSGVKKYKKKGYKAHDTGNHDNEKKVSNKTELEQALRELQSEIIASIDKSTSFVKEITDFYDSQNNLVKTQTKVSDKNGSMRTYTHSYSTDKEGNTTAWTSHID